MLKEWLKAMMIFLKNGHHVITRDVNNQKILRGQFWGSIGCF